ncbi:FancD2 domain containing protein [Trichuris trichiura]|uniref:FancD2 domain containing protein n=1 Tax=Trichuris trichiura TaxID=36087 RepID=A0A077Z035_TRITR|nr:FancD2 domain containing protein [Trichuris trichiura]
MYRRLPNSRLAITALHSPKFSPDQNGIEITSNGVSSEQKDAPEEYFTNEEPVDNASTLSLPPLNFTSSASADPKDLYELLDNCGLTLSICSEKPSQLRKLNSYFFFTKVERGFAGINHFKFTKNVVTATSNENVAEPSIAQRLFSIGHKLCMQSEDSKNELLETMLNQFRYLECVANSEVLVSCLLNFAMVAPRWLLEEIFYCIAEVVADEQHDCTGSKLWYVLVCGTTTELSCCSELMEEKPELTEFIADTFACLSLSDDVAIEKNIQLKEKLSNSIPSMDANQLTSALSFLLQCQSLSDAKTVILQLRGNVTTEKFFTGRVPDIFESAVRFRRYFDEAVAKVYDRKRFLSLIGNVPLQAFDLYLLLLLLKTRYQRSARLIIRVHVREGRVGLQLISEIFRYQEYLTSLLPDLLEFVGEIFEASEENLTQFASAMYAAIFMMCSDMQKEGLLDLVPRFNLAQIRLCLHIITTVAFFDTQGCASLMGHFAQVAKTTMESLECCQVESEQYPKVLTLCPLIRFLGNYLLSKEEQPSELLHLVGLERGDEDEGRQRIFARSFQIGCSFVNGKRLDNLSFERKKANDEQTAHSDLEEASGDDETEQSVDSKDSTGLKCASDKVVSVNPSLFREYDIAVFRLLNLDVTFKQTGDCSLKEISIDGLEHLVGDLDKKMESRVADANKQLWWLKNVDDCVSTRFKQLPNEELQQFLSFVVPLLYKHLEEVKENFCYEQLPFKALIDSYDGLLDHPNSSILKSDDLSDTFMNNEEASEENKVEVTALYLLQFTDLCRTFSAASRLLQLVRMLAESFPNKVMKEAIGGSCLGVLKRHWPVESSWLVFSRHVSYLLNICLWSQEENNTLKFLEDLTLKSIGEALESDCFESTTYQTFRKETLHTWYQFLLVTLCDDARKAERRLSALSTQEKFVVWALSVRLFRFLTCSVLPKVHKSTILRTAIKVAPTYVTAFTNSAIRLLDINFEELLDHVRPILQAMQQSTRTLQNMCTQLKANKDKTLIKFVPTCKRTLEEFVFRVKAMMAANKCLDAMQIANLKTRNLKGEDIVPSSTEEEEDNGSHDSGDAKSDEEAESTEDEEQ